MMNRAIVLMALACVVPAQEDATASKGQSPLASVGPIAFGPDQTLLVSDPRAASLFAFDISSEKAEGLGGPTEITAIGEKIAAALGTSVRDVAIVDVATNPDTQQVYLAVTRGQGPAALPVILRLDKGGKLSPVKLGKATRVALQNAPPEPTPGAGGRRARGPNRMEVITDLAFVDGRVVVAGLSNEEFSSKLRSLEWPLDSADDGTSIEIYHSAHGRYETNAPVRTFVPLAVGGEPHIVAAYTCTPLVLFPTSVIAPGQEDKFVGKTVAELGNRNRPLDMVIINSDDEEFLLMANNSRGVMKIKTADLTEAEQLTEKVDDTAGVAYETLADWTGVLQLDTFGKEHVIILVQGEDGGLSLKVVPNP